MSVKTEATRAQQVEDELAQLRRALATAQRAAARRRRSNDELVAAVYAAVSDSMLAHGPVASVPRPFRDKRGQAGRNHSTVKPEVALLHLTDWQLGKHSSSYSVDVCRARVMEAVARTIELTEIQRAHHPVRDCHVMFGGDMVEGLSIFPGQAHEVEANLYEQFVATGNLCAAAVLLLLEHFKTVTVWEEKGNHGRLGHKGEMPAGDNIDVMAYTLARALVGYQPRLTWHPFAGGVGTHVSIGNYTALLVHGDEIKSFCGNTPAFGILRKCTSWATGVLPAFDDVYMGHFHTPMTLTMPNAGRIFVAGSPESDNGYAKEFMAATGKPSQRLNFIDPAQGRVTCEYTLWLT